MATSTRPYLIRALHEWIVDNERIPHLLVDARYEGVQVPEQYVGEDGRIILNISPEATRGLLIGNDRIIFTTRFAGVSYQVFLPPLSVKAIYAKENGEGMAFPEEENNAYSILTVTEPTVAPPPAVSSKPVKATHRKPQLKVVRNEEK